MRSRVAFVVLNYNCKPFLKNCIDSMIRQEYKIKPKIFFVDNSSQDGSVELVRKNYSVVQIIENKENFGTSKGLNIGVKKAMREYDYIGIFNPDIILEKNWLKAAMSTLNSNSSVDVCTSLVTSWDKKNVETAGGTVSNLFLGILSGFLHGTPVRLISQEYKKKDFPVFFGVITAMLVRSAAFKRVGLFDENYFMCFEDSDLCWRMLNSGKKIMCNPQAIIYHYSHGSNPEKKLSLRLFRETETNVLATYYKNLSTASFISLIVPLVFFRTIFSLAYLFISFELTVTKLSGILQFFVNLFDGKYTAQKALAVKIKIVSDWDVLRNNPTTPFSFVAPFRYTSGWFKNIKKNIDEKY